MNSTPQKITLRLSDRSCPIYFSTGIQNTLVRVIRKHFKATRFIVVTNPTLDKLYGKALRSELQGLGKIEWIRIPDGERYKTLQTTESIYQKLTRLKADRHTPLIAFGGGVIGDVAGFAAATYLRGIPLIQIPTTLLAQVDSSVGGKTGVDLPQGKNLVGSFYQPHLVFIDVSLLKTLPRREILCGTAEVIKYGAIQDPKLFTLLEKSIDDFLKLDLNLVEKIVRTCVKIKAGIVEKDEKETLGLRMFLNFGHTLGHAIETLSGYRRFSHGAGVAMGMSFAAKLSVALGLTDQKTMGRLEILIERAGLANPLPEFSRNAYLEVMSRDKKAKAGKIQYVLLKKIGQVQAISLELEQIGALLENELKALRETRG